MGNDMIYVRNQECNYHYDNDNIVVFMSGSSTKLNPLYTEIVEKCDGKHTISDIEKDIFLKYEIGEEDYEARQHFLKVIEELLIHNIIKEVSKETIPNSVKSMTGKKGKLFPASLVLELTNKCNFCCMHCFKEAEVNSNNYINVSDLRYLISKLSVPLEFIEITGGECTLHPEINDIIEIAAKAAHKVSLLSNGSNIQAIASDKFSLIEEVQITIYGYDDISYKKFTSREHGFNAVKTGLEILKSKDCSLAIAICVTKENYKELDKFIEFACEFNPNEIRFSLVLPLGRASKNEYKTNWELSEKEFSEAAKKINEWADRLSPHIIVRRIDRPFLGEADDTSTLRCGGGKYRVAISENGIVRPCVYLPEDIFNMGTMKQYADDILDSKEFDFTDGVSEFKKRLLEDGFTVADMSCVGFCKSSTDSDC